MQALGPQMDKGGHPLARPLTYVAAWLFACAAAGCGSTVTTSTGPSPTRCTVTLAPPDSPVSSSGATTTVESSRNPNAHGLPPRTPRGSPASHRPLAREADNCRCGCLPTRTAPHGKGTLW